MATCRDCESSLSSFKKNAALNEGRFFRERTKIVRSFHPSGPLGLDCASGVAQEKGLLARFGLRSIGLFLRRLWSKM